jgi:hypothetical protein
LSLCATRDILGRVLRTMAAVVLAAGIVAATGYSSAGGAATHLYPVVRAALNGRTGPPKGDPNGSGTAVVKLSTKTRKACWTISIHGIKKPLSAHVRKAPPGKIGPVIIPLGARFSPTGCVSLPRKSIIAVETQPRGFYVDVLTRKYLNGALRGQLRAAG